MAIIIGATDAEEIKALRAAGYEFASLDSVKVLLKANWGSTVAVWVDCDISDLLSPPLCKFCGKPMETHEAELVVCMTGRPSASDRGIVHLCSGCGAWTQIHEHPPKEG